MCCNVVEISSDTLKPILELLYTLDLFLKAFLTLYEDFSAKRFPGSSDSSEAENLRQNKPEVS